MAPEPAKAGARALEADARHVAPGTPEQAEQTWR